MVLEKKRVKEVIEEVLYYSAQRKNKKLILKKLGIENEDNKNTTKKNNRVPRIL